jgi:hypothetical protein
MAVVGQEVDGLEAVDGHEVGLSLSTRSASLPASSRRRLRRAEPRSTKNVPSSIRAASKNEEELHVADNLQRRLGGVVK